MSSAFAPSLPLACAVFLACAPRLTRAAPLLLPSRVGTTRRVTVFRTRERKRIEGFFFHFRRFRNNSSPSFFSTSFLGSSFSPFPILKKKKKKKQNRPHPQRPAVNLCFGDSLTEGTLGADWVARLADSLAGTFGKSGNGSWNSGIVVVNAGVSGQLAAAVASRVERCVAACSGRVVGVFVMAGTNDVLAACAGRANRRRKKIRRSGGGGGGGGAGNGARASAPASFLSSLFPEAAAARRSLLGSLVRFCYRASNALPRAPLTRPAALAAVAAALDAAALAAPGAALAVATIPPLGSGGPPTSRANAAVRDLNRGIRCVASARPRVQLLDVHAALSAALAAKREEEERANRGFPLSSAVTTNAGGDDDAGDLNSDSEEEEEEEEDIALSVGPSCLASVLLRVFFRVSWDRAAQWKAFPAAAAAAATSLPQRLLLLSSSLLLRLSWRKSPTAATATAARKKKSKAKTTPFFSFSPGNSLLHDGVHFGETAGACVLALTLPWARRAARGKVGGGGSSASAAASKKSSGVATSSTTAGLATALSLASSPPSPSRRRGAVVAASTSKPVSAAVSVVPPPRESRNNNDGGSSSSSGGGKGGLSGALASAISLFASSR